MYASSWEMMLVGASVSLTKSEVDVDNCGAVGITLVVASNNGGALVVASDKSDVNDCCGTSALLVLQQHIVSVQSFTHIPHCNGNDTCSTRFSFHIILQTFQ